MTKKNRNILFIVLGSIIIGFIGFQLMKQQTKSYSPEETVTYNENGMELEVFYNRPYKKGREIFGGLVPYGEVWRTGANEATTFATKQDILVDGSLLKEGIYTLWTIPQEESWKVIFNSEMYSWGINTEKKASRLPEFDVLTLEVPVTRMYNEVEQFTISFETANDFTLMIIAWDKTAITIPIKKVGK